MAICDVLRDLVPFLFIKRVKNTHSGVSLRVLCFLRFLNCTNGTKLRKTSHMYSMD